MRMAFIFQNTTWNLYASAPSAVTVLTSVQSHLLNMPENADMTKAGYELAGCNELIILPDDPKI